MRCERTNRARKQNEVHVKSTKVTIKIIAAFVGLGFVATISVGPVSVQANTSRADAPFVQQIGTYDYLAGPNYQGLLPIQTISATADIGLGTFNKLDGEMVVLDGTVYRVGTDGVPRKVSSKRLTPFMQVVEFDPKASMRVAPNTACSALPEIVDTLTKSTQGIVSVKLSGVFYDLELRSVPAQQVPFPSLIDAVGSQVKFPLGRINATLVGFRQGPDAKGLGAPGLHLHGLSKSKASGGHVLSCVTGPRVLLEVQQTSGATVHMPHE